MPNWNVLNSISYQRKSIPLRYGAGTQPAKGRPPARIGGPNCRENSVSPLALAIIDARDPKDFSYRVRRLSGARGTRLGM
jgi:hypothetical protein